MIVVVCPNPAWDVTYTVDRLRPGATHRVREVAERAGGKGLNDARVLAALGAPVLVLGLAGGRTGELLRAGLDEAGLSHRLTATGAETRRTVAVVETERADATMFSEPGPLVTAAEWAALLATTADAARGADALVLSGSLPPGAPADGYAALGSTALGSTALGGTAQDSTTQDGSGGPLVALDADGETLRLGVAARPWLVKANAAEVAAAGGVARLRRAGASAVVVTSGRDGLSAFTPDGAWRAWLDTPVSGNPTGAGDAVLAALVHGAVGGADWPTRLIDATALGAAAVRAPVAGALDLADRDELRPAVRISTLPGPGAA